MAPGCGRVWPDRPCTCIPGTGSLPDGDAHPETLENRIQMIGLDKSEFKLSNHKAWKPAFTANIAQNLQLWLGRRLKMLSRSLGSSAQISIKSFTKQHKDCSIYRQSMHGTWPLYVMNTGQRYISLKAQPKLWFGYGNVKECPFWAAEECSAVLELDCKHSGALMLRAQTLVAMKDYHSALFDVNRLIELNPSSDVYRNLQARLKTQLSLAPIPEAEEELPTSDIEETESTKPPTHESPSPVLSPSPCQETSTSHPKGWDAIPKPKGHSGLDYSRWDKVDDDSSDEEDEDEDSEPQYRFRLRTVGVRPVT
eukprot:Gb_07647 [translate_table: standard]